MNDEKKALNDEELEASIKKAVKNCGDIKLVKLEDSINFKCKRCGKCCMGRDDIIMNPYDIYNIAVATGKETHEVIKEYTGMYIGNNSFLPVLTLREDDRNMCPFLKFYASEGVFGCSINDHKPGNCALHPVGIIRSLDTKTLEDKKDQRFILVDYCDYSKEANQQTKLEDLTKSYMDNIDSHNLGAKTQFEFVKYINVEKFIKAVIKNDKEYINENITSEEEREIIEELHESHSGLIDLMLQTYVASYISGTYKADTSRTFLEQEEEILTTIKENAIVIITVVSSLGIDIINPDMEKTNPEMQELIIKKTTEIKGGFETWSQEQ